MQHSVFYRRRAPDSFFFSPPCLLPSTDTQPPPSVSPRHGRLSSELCHHSLLLPCCHRAAVESGVRPYRARGSLFLLHHLQLSLP